MKKNFFVEFDFLKNIGIFFSASLIAGACNYLYQLYMGRTLGPEEYGIFGSIFALSYIITIIARTVETSGARFVSKFIGEKNYSKIIFFTKGLLLRMGVVGLMLFTFTLLISNHIASFLKINFNEPIIILASIFLFSTLLPVNSGVMQGLEKFTSLGFTRILNYSSKLIVGIILVYLGFGVNGAIAGLVIGFIIALLFSFFPLKKYFSKNKKINTNFNFSELYTYSLPTMIAMFCFSVPTNVDLILVKHFFEPQIAGLYTAVTVLGKIMIFVPAAIGIVIFPKISKTHAMNKNTLPILNTGLLYTSILSGGLAFIYFIIPELVIKIPFGVEYISIAPVLQIYSVITFFFSLTVVIMRYNLAIHNLNYIFIISFFTLLEILLLIFFHSTLIQIAYIFLIVNISLFLSSYLYVKRKIKHFPQ